MVPEVVIADNDTGGAGGIRTLDTGLSPYNGLANRRLQPLGHSSAGEFQQPRPSESQLSGSFCSGGQAVFPRSVSTPPPTVSGTGPVLAELPRISFDASPTAAWFAGIRSSSKCTPRRSTHLKMSRCRTGSRRIGNKGSSTGQISNGTRDTIKGITSRLGEYDGNRTGPVRAIHLSASVRRIPGILRIGIFGLTVKLLVRVVFWPLLWSGDPQRTRRRHRLW